MPRDYESDGHQGPIVLSAAVDCPDCACEFDGVWVDDSIDFEQMVEPPNAVLTCPRCGSEHGYDYPGYWNYGDAG